MTQLTIKFQPVHLGRKEPAVLVPMAVWNAIEEALEDLEAMRSKTLRRKVAQARQDKRRGLVIPFSKIR